MFRHSTSIIVLALFSTACTDNAAFTSGSSVDADVVAGADAVDSGEDEETPDTATETTDTEFGYEEVALVEEEESDDDTCENSSFAFAYKNTLICGELLPDGTIVADAGSIPNINVEKQIEMQGILADQLQAGILAGEKIVARQMEALESLATQGAGAVLAVEVLEQQSNGPIQPDREDEESYSVRIYELAYSEAENKITQVGTEELATTRTDFTLANVGTESVLIAGGLTTSGVATRTVEVYDIAQHKLASTTLKLNVARSGAEAVTLKSGDVLIAGGKGTSGILTSAELYNASKGSFQLLSSKMLTERSGFNVTLLSDGNVLISGGVDASGNAIASVELFNTSTQSFSQVGSLSNARTGHSVAVLSTGTALFVGGTNGANSVTAVESFSSSTGKITTSSLSVNRTGARAMTLSGGQVALVGGVTNTVSVTNTLVNSVTTTPQTGLSLFR